MPLIDKKTLLGLFGGSERFERIIGNSEYNFDDKGISCKIKFKEGSEKFKLKLPCLPLTLLDWAYENQLDGFLPDDFIQLYQADFISFYDAKDLLSEKLETPPNNEEFYLWCILGKIAGGLDPFLSNGNGIIERWAWAPGINMPFEYDNCYLILEDFYFLQSDIELFVSPDRYISGQAIIERWKPIVGEKVAINRLSAIANTEKLVNCYPCTVDSLKDGVGGIYSFDNVLDYEKNNRIIIVENTQIEDLDKVGIVQTYSFEELEKPKDFDDFIIDNLLRLSIPAFFIEAKIVNDYFKQGLYVGFWKRALKNELTNLEKEIKNKNIGVIEGINYKKPYNDKLKELSAWSNKDFWPKPEEQTSDENTNLSLKTQAEVLTTNGKPRKRLKPLIRETNEGLLLIKEITSFYNVNYLEDLPAVIAWGKIVSGEFQSNLIKSVSDAKKSITLHGGEKLDKKGFSDKYRRRFE